MPKPLVPLLTAAALSLSLAAQAAGVASTFDTDADGWTVSDLAGGARSMPNRIGGLIQAGDWYGYNTFQAPAKFLGDLSGHYGGSFRFDLQSAWLDGLSDRYYALAIRGVGGDTLVWFGGAPSTTTLTTFSASLSEAVGHWELNPGYVFNLGTGPTPTAAQFKAVLGNVAAIHINGDWHAGSDNVQLDNVRLAPVPEPQGGALMLAGLVALAGVRHRRVRAR